MKSHIVGRKPLFHQLYCHISDNKTFDFSLALSFIILGYLKHVVSYLRKIYLLIFHTRMWKISLINHTNPHSLTEKRKESLVTGIYVGAVFIVLAAIYFVNLP